MRPPTLVRLALAGTRTDTLRVVLTALSAALAALIALAALTVLAIPTPPMVGDNWSSQNSTQYTNNVLIEPGLRPGVVIALILLTIPVLALAGQCARLGAPARERRLAAIRLAGATPGQAIAIIATETGVASLLGTGFGTAVYLVGRRVLHRPDAEGRLALPTDVLPAPGALIAVLIGLPLLTALIGAFLARRTVITPFRVYRRTRRDGSPWPWPGVLIALGLFAAGSADSINRRYGGDNGADQGLMILLLLGGGVLAALGVVLGTGWLSYTSGRLLHRFGRSPATLLAARRLIADPWTGSRTFGAMLAAVLFGAGAAGARAYFQADDRVREAVQRQHALAAGQPQIVELNDPFYLRTVELVDVAVIVALSIAAAGLLVALVEGIVSRRRAYAALIATGVPASVLGRSVAWQALAPVVPAIVMALTVGVLLARGFFGTPSHGGYSYTVCDAGPALCDNPATSAEYSRTVAEPLVGGSVPVPLAELALYGAGALGAVLVMVGVGLLFLRRSTTLTELRVA
ncbi:FtsX-like permease family protein [Micromonospora sp. NBC_01796]|uniref:FtsX-like permease family protein n=1 Tax=Micromonospora sp. NBC_01796 TaxID=2975987 RepID=UPI002DD93D93|nr:FtsX-like permease family protein [Micromonospora sp. NBC_01796]WSA88216.1 ABC transporter permease [Micromonospora sp. NBC_01796]